EAVAVPNWNPSGNVMVILLLCLAIIGVEDYPPQRGNMGYTSGSHRVRDTRVLHISDRWAIVYHEI
ncbi:hypothetical protein, partial [Bifidobacterium longum]|uniref:hypothetical protein n=1 Tax=Bifidobacterium longum TaxID=216816 RepID=UPI003F774CC4